MTAEQEKTPEEVYEEVWRGLADLVNELPMEKRKYYVHILGKFMHDMRHTLGLITNSQDLLRRDIVEKARISDPMSLLNIIQTASMRGSVLVESFVQGFAHQVELD